MNRRSFIQQSSRLAASAAFIPHSTFFPKRLNRFGAMLYTVRELMQVDPANTLLKIREMGYFEIEQAGYDEGMFYGMKPKDFQTMCYQRGLKIISGHVTTGFNTPQKQRTMVRNWGAALDDFSKIDQDFVVLSYLNEIERKTIDDYKRIADLLNECGEQSRKRGIRMTYHNHDFEFITLDGQTPYDVLLENTDPKFVTFQMDIYWAYKVGVDPVTYFEKYPGRFELWHVKDMDATDEKYFTEVGNGVIDWSKIFQHIKLSGMRHFFVEQDHSKDHDLLHSLKISQNYLSSLRF